VSFFDSQRSGDYGGYSEDHQFRATTSPGLFTMFDYRMAPLMLLASSAGSGFASPATGAISGIVNRCARRCCTNAEVAATIPPRQGNHEHQDE